MSYANTITNHTRITVKSKKTGQVVVILEDNPSKSDYRDPSVGAFVPTGIPITECIDDSLDTMVFTVRENPTRELFKAFDIVTFTVDDGIEEKAYEMCVASDHAKMVSRMDQLYDHIVTVVELTKILEKVKIFNLNLTNPHDSLLLQFQKALTNAEPVLRSTRSVDGITVVNFQRRCRFSISERLRALLNGKPSEDFYNGNTDLRAVLDNILAKLNCRVCVTHVEFDAENNISDIVLDYRSMTATRNVSPIWTFEEQGEIEGDEAENNAQDFAGTIFARGYNSLSDEPISFTSMFKSASKTLNSENACAMLPFPIGEGGVKEFVINAKFQVFRSNNPATWNYLKVDIAKHLIAKELFDLLPDSSSDDIDKEHFIPYQIGSTIIGSGETFGLIWKTSSICMALMACVVEQYPNEKLKEIFGSDDVVGINTVDNKWFNSVFKMTYYPQADTADALSKPNVYDKDELLLGIVDNQSENTLNMQRHGRRLESLIKRTGNDAYYLDVRAKYYSKLLPLMSKIDLPTDKTGHTQDDYVLYKRDIAVYDGHVNCRYYFSKDYNAVQEYAGVRREKHLYDIPLESEECPLVIRKYLVFGFENGNAERGFFPDFMASALRTLTGENKGREYISKQVMVDNVLTNYYRTSTGKVNFMLFSAINRRADGTEETLPGEKYVTFMLPCLTYGKGKAMNFISRTLDNYSVDYSRSGYQFSIWGDAGHLITYNRYVSDEAATAGECTKFRMNLAFESGVIQESEEFMNYEEAIKSFPVVDNSFFATCLENKIEFDYYKDRTQRPLFCHVLECVPTAADYGNLIIGSAFCRDNNLVCENGNGLQGLKLVVSHTQTIDDDAEWISSDFTGDYPVADHFEVKTDSSSNTARLEYKGGIESGVTAWAIVNAQGEIYIAAGGEPRTVYAWIMDFPK